jgi:MFS family permease
MLAVALGGTPLGAPIVGWVADVFGPRWSIAVGATSGIAAALVGVFYLIRYRRLSIRRESWRLRYTLDLYPHEYAGLPH